MARYAAFLDACVIVPIAPCDTLLRMAEAGTFRPLWSQRVLDEALWTLRRIHPHIDESRFESRFHSMNEAFEDALDVLIGHVDRAGRVAAVDLHTV